MIYLYRVDKDELEEKMRSWRVLHVLLQGTHRTRGVALGEWGRLLCEGIRRNLIIGYSYEIINRFARYYHNYYVSNNIHKRRPFIINYIRIDLFVLFDCYFNFFLHL